MDVPYTPDDLERIAKALREWERLLVDKDGDFRPRSELVRSIEITRPDTDQVVGRFIVEDGWVGFQFGGNN